MIPQDVKALPRSIEQAKCQQLAAACSLPRRSIEHYLRAPEDPVNQAWLSHFEEERRACRAKQHHLSEQWKQDSSTIRSPGPLFCQALFPHLSLSHAHHVFFMRALH